MATPQPADAAVAAEPHPRGLYVLFFTEMWERFSYYGMRALLVLYMVNYFKWAQDRALNIYKWYTTLVYLTPIAGGYIADRWTRQGKAGNKRAVIIGATLMAIGHFLMAFDAISIFYVALVFLIFGNGMFKPNMSTQVGRLYPANDARRDGAYTIFYMGINLGAFLSPLVCGYLREHKGFHWGFGAAGVGMLIGLITYLVGLPLVKEVSGKADAASTTGPAPEPEEAPSALPRLSRIAPSLVLALSVGCFAIAVVFKVFGGMSWDNVIALLMASVALLAMGSILRRIQGAARDRSMAIYALFIFVVFFWAAFEQAGSAMNLWADQVTDRYATVSAPEPSVYPTPAPAVGFDAPASVEAPAATAEGSESLIGDVVMWWRTYWNPVSTEAFQSINAIAIVIFAPLFAMLWTWLSRRGRSPSIPAKMATGVLLMGSAFGLMILAAKAEDRPTEAALEAVPPSLIIGPDHVVSFRDPPDFTGEVTSPEPTGAAVIAQAGRLRFEGGQLHMRGVLAEAERDRVLRSTAPASFVKKAMELSKKSNEAQDKQFKVEVTLDEVPPGLDLRFSGLNEKNLHFDPATRVLSVENLRLADKDYKGILQAASPPAFRDALNQLYVKSARYKVSSWWLVWFYVLSTFGELCLSPVGLSMVSKLAPAKFATVLMGIWLLINAFANFLAGAVGESWWGTWTPTTYFVAFFAALSAMAMVLYWFGRTIEKMMHGVK